MALVASRERAEAGFGAGHLARLCTDGEIEAMPWSNQSVLG